MWIARLEYADWARKVFRKRAGIDGSRGSATSRDLNLFANHTRGMVLLQSGCRKWGGKRKYAGTGKAIVEPEAIAKDVAWELSQLFSNASGSIGDKSSGLLLNPGRLP